MVPTSGCNPSRERPPRSAYFAEMPSLLSARSVSSESNQTHREVFFCIRSRALKRRDFTEEMLIPFSRANSRCVHPSPLFRMSSSTTDGGKPAKAFATVLGYVATLRTRVTVNDFDGHTVLAFGNSKGQGEKWRRRLAIRIRASLIAMLTSQVEICDRALKSMNVPIRFNENIL